MARIRTGNPFRCVVTDPQLLPLMKSLSCHRTAHQLTNSLVGPQSCYIIIRLMCVYRGAQGKNITASTRSLYGGGGRKIKAKLLRFRQQSTRVGGGVYLIKTFSTMTHGGIFFSYTCVCVFKLRLKFLKLVLSTFSCRGAAAEIKSAEQCGVNQPSKHMVPH